MGEWKEQPLIDVIELIGGGTPKTTVRSYWNGTIPWLSVKDFNNGKRYVYFTEKTITEEGLTNSSTKLLKKDDIIISARGTVGEVAMIPYPMAFNQSCYGIRAKDGYDAAFLYYLIKSSISRLKLMTHGSVFDTITRDTFANILVQIPDVNTQEKIASILTTIDDKIEKNQKINDNLQQQALALFDYFFPYAPANDIPTNWRICALSDVTENIRTRVKNQNCTVLSAVNTGELQPSEEYFTKQVFSKDISNYIVVEENNFAYNPARVNIGSIGINNLGLLGCVSPVYVVFRVEEDYQYFFDFFIKTPRFREEVKTRASGSVRQAMNYSDFGLISIAYPPKSVIDNFNHLYLPIYRHMEHRKEENVRLAELRDMLLPKLLSGEIDVSDVQI